MLHRFARIFVSLLLEAANEFILEVHSHVSKETNEAPQE